MSSGIPKISLTFGSSTAASSSSSLSTSASTSTATAATGTESNRKKIPTLTLNPLAKSAITANARKSSGLTIKRKKPANASGGSNRKAAASLDDGFLKANHKEDHLIMRILDSELLASIREASHGKVLTYGNTILSNNELENEFFYSDVFSLGFVESDESGRKGSLTFAGKTYPTLLVDLPCIIESQKTFDHKRYFKTADIAQMLLIGELPADLERRTIEERYR